MLGCPSGLSLLLSCRLLYQKLALCRELFLRNNWHATCSGFRAKKTPPPFRMNNKDGGFGFSAASLAEIFNQLFQDDLLSSFNLEQAISLRLGFGVSNASFLASDDVVGDLGSFHCVLGLVCLVLFHLIYTIVFLV